MPKTNDEITLDQVKTDIRRARSNINGAKPSDQAKVMAQIAQAEATLLLLESVKELRTEIQNITVNKEDTVTHEEMKSEINSAIRRVTQQLTN